MISIKGTAFSYHFNFTHTNTTVDNLLYIVAVVLIFSWALGFFAFKVGSIIHVLLVIAIIVIMLKVIKGNNIVK